MSNFLSEALRLLDQGHSTELASVFKYRFENDTVERILGANFSNLEDLFSLVDLHARVNKEVRGTRDDFVRLILTTLARTIKEEHRSSRQIFGLGHEANQSTGTLSLSEAFISVVGNRCWPIEGTSPNSIISLNYDTVMEDAMSGCNMRADYCIGDQSSKAGVSVKMLKLHGSANWGYCPTCKGTIQLIRDWKAHYTSVERRTPCDKCNDALTSIIVPPSWDKSVHHESIQEVWQRAFQELSTARRWVFIGLSLAPTDRYLLNLLALAIKANERLDRIVVYDKGEAPNFQRLFESIPSRIGPSGIVVGERG